MTDKIDPGGSNPAPAIPHDDDGPIAETSMTAARALAAPATVDRAARTVEVVWSTGARARNFVPPLGMITEELDMSPSAVRMDGLRSGSAPVLNTHRKADARDVVGRVVAAWLEAGCGYATLQFSNATDVEPLWQRVADGTLRSVSVGYRVHRYETVTDPRDGTVHRAVDWEPYEISVVPIPVDPAAAVRGASAEGVPATAIEPALPIPDTATPTNATPSTNAQEPPMPDTTPVTPAVDPAPPAPAATPTSSTPAQADQEAAPTMPSNTPTAPAAADADRGAPTVPPGDAAAEVIRAERARIAALGPSHEHPSHQKDGSSWRAGCTHANPVSL
jgi:hypothetical protein